MYHNKIIKNLVKITKGRHYPSPSVSQFWDHENGFLWLKIGDIKPYTNDSKCKLSQKGVETIKNAQNFLFKKNSFVMAMVGVGSVGKIGWLKENFYSSTAIINFDCENSILKKYLYYFFLKNRKKIEWFQNGTTGLKSIKSWQLEKFEINLPDCETQKKIVEEIDCLYNFILKNKQKIKLTIEKYQNLLEFKLHYFFNDFKNHNYQKKFIKDLVKITSGVRYPDPTNLKYWSLEKGHSWLKGGDVKDYIFDSKLKVTEIGMKKFINYKKCFFEKDSFVVVNVGSTIGKVGWLKKNMFVSDSIFNLDCNDLILKKYLYYFFKKNRQKIFNLKKGTAIPSIKMWQLEILEINLPDSETQKKVVEELDHLFHYCKQKIKTLEKEEKLFQELLEFKLHYFYNFEI